MTEKVLSVATLNDHTTQEVFDHVAAHLLSQNTRSRLEDSHVVGGCAYRGTRGRTCAAGYIISDDEYHPSIESDKWEKALTKLGYLPESTPHTELILSLQDIHDRTPVYDWFDSLGELAAEQQLNTQVMDKFKKANKYD